MTITTPLGLLALITIPIIIILYMLKPKNKDHILPSLYLWQQMESEIESAKKLEKLKSNILMILQIITAALISLMLAGLFIKGSTNSEKVIMIIDCSVSMKSTDIEPTRMEQGKIQGINYLKGLKKDTKISLIALKDIPEILITEETNPQTVKATIENLTPTDTYTDPDLIQETINTLKDEKTQIIYIGDTPLEDAENIIISKNDNNLGITNISYTIYENSNQINALIDIKNEGKEKATIPVSLYIDDLFFDAKQIEIQGKETGKLFFENIPIEAKTIKAEIDKKDILEIDNTAITPVSQIKEKKVVLVTKANIFLEKALKLHKNINLYMGKPEDIDKIKNFDLYIFDQVLPKDLPTDGSIMAFNPPENQHFNQLGYGKNPEITTKGNQITNHIETPSFLVGATSIYELPSWAQPVYETQYGTVSFAGSLNNTRILVHGFDLHATDLPLVIDFPILISNSLDYLLATSTLSQTNIRAGETIEIRILPNTEEAYIITPDNQKDQLEITKDLSLYKNTLKTGIYTLVQKPTTSNNQTTTEQFAVNVPAKPTRQKPENNQENTQEKTTKTIGTTSPTTPYKILGIIVLIILLIEWFIYNHRRRLK